MTHKAEVNVKDAAILTKEGRGTQKVRERISI
jgi:hypothetical protein